MSKTMCIFCILLGGKKIRGNAQRLMQGSNKYK